MMLPTGTLILVAAGARMLLLRNAGDADCPHLEVVEHRSCKNLPNRELTTDAPGLSFSSSGQKRHTYDEGDPHDSEEVKFLHSALEALDNLVGEGSSPVIVAAPPHALGVLRTRYTARVKNRLKAELEKDLTHLPVSEIALRLAAA